MMLLVLRASDKVQPASEACWVILGGEAQGLCPCCSGCRRQCVCVNCDTSICLLLA